MSAQVSRHAGAPGRSTHLRLGDVDKRLGRGVHDLQKLRRASRCSKQSAARALACLDDGGTVVGDGGARALRADVWCPALRVSARTVVMSLSMPRGPRVVFRISAMALHALMLATN